ncbi:MAG: hypothetical protein PHU85_08985 [Phycisphaerae bacterium]|nr:hypothetical protein [Phycisphaerae bacterium]
MKAKSNKSIEQLITDYPRVTRAMGEGVRAALLEHKRAGRSIVVWENGKVVTLPPEKILVEPARRNGRRRKVKSSQ